MKTFAKNRIALCFALLFTPSLYAFEIMSDAELFSAIDAEGDHETIDAVLPRINYALDTDQSSALLDAVLSGIDSEYVTGSTTSMRVSYLLTPGEENDQVSALFESIGGGNDY